MSRAAAKVAGLVAVLLLAGCAARIGTKPNPDAAAAPAAAAARLDLEQRLPADTHLFIRMDPARLLADMQTTMHFVDPELADQAVEQTRRAWRSLVTMAANRGFAPRLAGELFSNPIYLVGRFLEPGPGPGGGAAIDDDEGRLGMALVLDCGPDLAADFLVQLRAELERDEDQAGGPGQTRWSQVDVERGELIRLGEEELYAGSVDGFLILAVFEPHWLWQAIGQPAAASLADSERYGRFGMGDPAWYGWIDLRTAVAAADRQAEREHQQLLRRADGLEGLEGRVLRQSAEASRQAYLQVQRLLSLDRLSALGARLTFEAEAGRLRYGLIGALAFDEPLSRTMDLLLDGGRAFRLPAGRSDSGLAFLWRFGMAGIYAEVTGQLPEQARRQVQIMEASVQSATGYSVVDLLKLLAGDVYLLLDFLADPAEGGKAGPPPVRTLTLLGINDLQATERALNAVYEAVTQLEGAGTWLGRREYLGREVYLIGPPGPQGERDPAQSMAVALLTDHLAIGDWDRVTDRIRASQAAGGERIGPLAGVIDGHREASLLVVMTRELWQRLEREFTKEGDEPGVEELIAGLQELELTAQDDPAERELRDALVRLLQISRELSEREAGLGGGDLVLHGQRRGPLYEIELEASLLKR